MRVLVFGFSGDPATNPNALHNIGENCVVYTGTHDTNTVKGWLREEMGRGDRTRLFRYLGRRIPADALPQELVRLAMMSPARLAVLPLQDLLGLGAESRINRPGSVTDNWVWRLTPGQFAACPARVCGDDRNLRPRLRRPGKGAGFLYQQADRKALQELRHRPSPPLAGFSGENVHPCSGRQFEGCVVQSPPRLISRRGDDGDGPGAARKGHHVPGLAAGGMQRRVGAPGPKASGKAVRAARVFWIRNSLGRPVSRRDHACAAVSSGLRPAAAAAGRSRPAAVVRVHQGFVPQLGALVEIGHPRGGAADEGLGRECIRAGSSRGAIKAVRSSTKA